MNIQLSQIIIQMINFGIVIFVLVKFVYKPVVNILKQRSEKIEQGQLEAQKALKQGESSDREAKKILSQAKQEAQKILDSAKSDADKQAANIISAAKTAAKKTAEAERQNQMAALETERQAVYKDLAVLVTATTKQVLQSGLTEADQHKLIQAQLKTLTITPPSA